MGVSAGGMIAIDFTLAHPDMVDGLVLVGAAVDGFKISDHMRQRGQAAARPIPWLIGGVLICFVGLIYY